MEKQLVDERAAEFILRLVLHNKDVINPAAVQESVSKIREDVIEEGIFSVDEIDALLFRALPVVRDEMIEELCDAFAETDSMLERSIDGIRKALAKPVREVDFTPRIQAIFRAAGWQNIGQVVRNRPSDLMKLRNFGSKSLAEVRGAINGIHPGLYLGMDVDKYLSEGSE